MPTKTLPTQEGNSCAAHCTAIAVMELDSTAAISMKKVQESIWPMMQFQDGPLKDAKNSDPIRIVSTVKKLWPKRTAKLMCDPAQKNAAMAGVPDGFRGALDGLFQKLKAQGHQTHITLEDLAYYNCSFTMTTGGTFEGMHNMLVTLQGKRAHFYNPQSGKWRVANHWQKISDLGSEFIFGGVAVAIF